MAKGDLGVYSIHVICAGKNTSTENKELDQVLHFIISLGWITKIHTGKIHAIFTSFSCLYFFFWNLQFLCHVSYLRIISTRWITMLFYVNNVKTNEQEMSEMSATARNRPDPSQELGTPLESPAVAINPSTWAVTKYFQWTVHIIRKQGYREIEGCTCLRCTYVHWARADEGLGRWPNRCVWTSANSPCYHFPVASS